MPESMTPDDFAVRWASLTRRATRDAAAQSAMLPPGFATRVAARAMAHRRQKHEDPWSWALKVLLPAATAPVVLAALFFINTSLSLPTDGLPAPLDRLDPVPLLAP